VNVGPVVNSSVQLIFVDAESGTNVTTIHAGDIVTWVWKSDGHSVTSALQPNDPLYFESNVINNGSVFRYQFDTPGRYIYTCVPHEGLGMVATVVVLPAVVIPPDYTVSIAPNLATIHQGQSTTFTFNITPSGGFAGAVNFACNTVPVQVTCTFSPATLNVNGASATSTLTVSIAGNSAAWNGLPSGGRAAPVLGSYFFAGLCGLVLAGNLRQKISKDRKIRLLQLFVITWLLLFFISCGGDQKPSLQLGVSPITISTSSPTGSLSHPAVVYINVVQ